MTSFTAFSALAAVLPLWVNGRIAGISGVVSGLLVPGGPGLVSARRVLAALLCGTVFGAGLAVAQRTNPRKVVGFLDFTRAWDPSLLPVLGGAVILSAVAFQRETAQRRPPARRFTTATMRSTSSQVL